MRWCAPRLLAVSLAICLQPSLQAAEHWPSYRGESAQGVAEGRPLPLTWNVPAGENVKWRTPVPGLGHSSVVVWGDKIFLTTAISGVRDPELKVGLYGDIKPVNDDSVHRFQVIALDKESGDILWTRTAHEGVPKIKRHTKSTHANSTPATDGERVVAFFGSEGLYSYDLDGELQWKKDFGVLDSGFFMVKSAQWGFASSPVIHDGKVIIQADVQEGSFLTVLDLEDGHEIWRTTRDDVPTWSTPAILNPPSGGAQIVVNGFRHIGGYDFATGAEVWRMAGGGDIPVPTPIVAHDLIFVTNAHGREAPILAIRPQARGDISLEGDATSNEGVAWSQPRDGGYMQTPIVYGDYLYVCRDNGVLSCLDARTGERQYKTRIGAGGSGFSSSPVAADGKIYFASEFGDVHVIKAGPEFEELAVNELDEIHMSTPAISDGVLFFRTRGHVVAIADLDL
jgi:outer membrane protein assembly factor BamB